MRVKNNLTKRQKEVLTKIYNYIKTSGFPPSFADLKEELGVISNQTILDLLKILEGKKMIRREEGSARAIRILSRGYEILGFKALVPISGYSAAGPFIEAVEQAGEWKEVSGELSELENVFFVKVRGDSMVNANIDDGDLVLVKESQEFSSGKIVLAETPCEGVTIKRFIAQNKSPYKYLKPENPNYNITVFTKNMRLCAIALKIFKQDGRVLDIK